MGKFQQQMQQQRRMMAGKAWMDQKRRERERIEGMAPPDFRAVDKFDALEDEAARLRQDFDAGRISSQQLDAKFKELMVQDARGNWWMVGSQTGSWYRHDGASWIPDTPPHHKGARHRAVMGGPTSSTKGGLGRRLAALFILGVGLAGSAMAFVVVGNITDTIIPGVFPFVTAAIAGLIGLLWTVRKTRDVWNG